MPSSIVIVEDEELVRAGTRLALEKREDLEVVAEAHDCASATTHIKNFRPDALVLDLALPDGDGLELLGTCRLHSPHTRTLALSSHRTREWADRALNAGCAGYLDKSAGLGEIAPAVQSILRGRTVVSIPTLVEQVLASECSPSESREPLASEILTFRENEVLGHIAMGLTNQQAADALFLSVKTVETYRSRLMRKLGLHGRSELFAYAMAQGLIGPAADARV